MKNVFLSFCLGLAYAASFFSLRAENPVITSFSQNGVLVCNNLGPGTMASVQWASSLTGPWQTNWDSLAAISVGTNGCIQVSVPMFYRVVGIPATNSAPAGMVLIPAGAFTMGNVISDGDLTDAVPVSVTVSAFYIDTNLVSFSQWQSVYNYATNHGYTLHLAAGKAANHPVQSLNWFDAAKWCNARSQQAGVTPVYYTDAGLTQVYTNGDSGTTVYANWSSKGFRLPTEAEWEKAARGGSGGMRFPWSNTNAISESQANYFAATASLITTGDRTATTQTSTTADILTPGRWVSSLRTATAFSTWPETCWSGVGIGMERRMPAARTRAGRPPARNAFCAAAVGSTVLRSRGRPAARIRFRATPPPATDCGV